MEQKPDNSNVKPQDEMQAMRYLQQLYQNQYSAIINELNQMVGHLGELNAAAKTLENCDVIEGKGMMMHIGANIYINTSAAKLDKVLVSVGGGWIVEKVLDDAKRYIGGRTEKVTGMYNKLSRNKKELETAIIEVSQRMEQLSR